MGITISETSPGSVEGIRFGWEKISHALEPEIQKLPEEDREYYQGILRFLIGKEIRLSNIPPRHMYLYIKRADWIVTMTRYPMLFHADYIRGEIVRYLNRLGTRISENGLGWKFGPMGFQEQRVKQEVVGIPPERIATSGREG